MSPRVLALSFLVLAGCPRDDEIEWVRFNGEDDVVTVRVTPDPESEDPVTTDLRSTSGARVVGEARVDPGAAPVDTDHRVTVDVRDRWERVVGRVTVLVDAGARGVEEFELDRDSADHGHWFVTVTSAGQPDEERQDTFTFRLFTEAGTTVPEDTDPPPEEEAREEEDEER